MRGAMWWIDRWRKSTAYTDMNAEEQGLYRNLCDEVWLRPGGVIPEESLGRASGDPIAWQRSGEKVLRWMKRVPGGWTNPIALEVKTTSEELKQTRSKAGSKGGATTQARRRANGLPKVNPPSPSPSPSPSPEREQTHGRTEPGNGDHPGVRLNPLIEGHRPDWERRCLALVRELSGLNGQDPTEVLRKAAHYEGAQRAKVNPASMSDDRLILTVQDLEANIKQWKERHP